MIGALKQYGNNAARNTVRRQVIRFAAPALMAASI